MMKVIERCRAHLIVDHALHQAGDVLRQRSSKSAALSGYEHCEDGNDVEKTRHFAGSGESIRRLTLGKSTQNAQSLSRGSWPIELIAAKLEPMWICGPTIPLGSNANERNQRQPTVSTGTAAETSFHRGYGG